MFRRKKPVLEPNAIEGDVLIQKTAPVTIDKKTAVSVPNAYKAIAFVDEKPMFRIEPCAKRRIAEAYGKEYLDKQLQVAFVLPKAIAQSAWGFGNIQVNNEGLKEAYRIGANGKFTIEVLDYAKTIQVFPGARLITAEQIREKLISTLKSVGTPILGEYFSKTSTSVFQMSSLIGDFRDSFLKALQEERIFADMGVKITSLTVDGLHANEDDLELIRNRINT